MAGNYISPLPIVPLSKVKSDVEHRSAFNLDRCELNIYQTLQPAQDFLLKFDGFTVTSMLRGRKVMHLEGLNGFNYFPGETVICPREAIMRIDFPDAQPDTPTQCTALVIEDAYLQEQIDFLNMTAPSQAFGGPLKIDAADAHFRNSENLVRITEKLLKITRSDHPRKDTFADLALKEMVLSIVQEQQLRALLAPENAKNSGPFTALLQFVHGNLSNEITVEQLCKVAGMSKSQLYREFNDTFGIAPKQFILNERIKHARLLLQQEDLSVKEACYASGFSDPNYFVRAFKKVMGVTPGRMQKAN